MWAIIGTWRMSKEGIELGRDILAKRGKSDEAIIKSIMEVENTSFYKSVGYGGLPNRLMEVELDAGYMDGTSLNVGAIMALRDYANPILIAKSLSEEKLNNVLVADGAMMYAKKNKFEYKKMLTERAKDFYHKRLENDDQELKPYDGHDTVGVCALDERGNIIVGTSTSGLFMKEKGRVGDSPLVGSGFYADSKVGGAVATGLGEDLMKGVISYEIVSLMKSGHHPQDACDIAVKNLNDRLVKQRKKAGDISVVAINNLGEYGASSNIDEFSYVVASKKQDLNCYVIKNIQGQAIHKIADNKWLAEYLRLEKANADEMEKNNDRI